MTECEDCGEPATTEWEDGAPVCDACRANRDNYEPRDADGEDICRDYAAERRDAQQAARELKQ